MRTDTFKPEAEECRRKAATAFDDRPEKAFLLRLAGMFDELASEAAAPRTLPKSPVRSCRIIIQTGKLLKPCRRTEGATS